MKESKFSELKKGDYFYFRVKTHPKIDFLFAEDGVSKKYSEKSYVSKFGYIEKIFSDVDVFESCCDRCGKNDHEDNFDYVEEVDGYFCHGCETLCPKCGEDPLDCYCWV